MEYHKTRDIIYVQEILGHKSILSTRVYIAIEKAMYKEAEDNYISAVAKDIQDTQKLVDVGFEYVYDYGTDGKLFRKRK